MGRMRAGTQVPLSPADALPTYSQTNKIHAVGYVAAPSRARIPAYFVRPGLEPTERQRLYVLTAPVVHVELHQGRSTEFKANRCSGGVGRALKRDKRLRRVALSLPYAIMPASCQGDLCLDTGCCPQGHHQADEVCEARASKELLGESHGTEGFNLTGAVYAKSIPRYARFRDATVMIPLSFIHSHLWQLPQAPMAGISHPLAEKVMDIECVKREGALRTISAKPPHVSRDSIPHFLFHRT